MRDLVFFINYWHSFNEIRRPIDVKLNNITPKEIRRFIVNMSHWGTIGFIAFEHQDLSDLR